MADKSVVTKFSTAIERAFTETPKPADRQEDFDRWYPRFASADYNTAIGTIVGVKDASLLNDLRDAYLKLYFKYAANKLNVHFARSDQVFFELFDRCRQLSTKKRDLLSEWAVLLDDKKDSQVKKRFQELSPTYQSKIRALIPRPPAPVKTILDFLRDEYQKQRGYPPKSNVDLYDFDPRGETLKAGFEATLLALQRAWQACIPANDEIPNTYFHSLLKSYRVDYLAPLSKQGILQLLQVIKYLQDRIFLRRENMGSWTRISGGDTDPLTCELYATACIQLLKFAKGNLLLESNRDGFTTEERAYFLAPLRSPKREYVYYSNIEDRFTRPLLDVPATFALTDTFLDLMLLTRCDLAGTSLVPLGEQLRVRNRWKVFEDLGEKAMKFDANAVAQILAEPKNKKALDEFAELLEIEVPIGNKEIGLATARIGASPGVHKTYGQVTIIHIDPKNWKHNDFYIEFAALKPALFLVHTDYITEKVYGSRVYDVHRSTVGITHVVEIMFTMMGFMPVIVEAGFAGLIQEVLIAYASGKAEEVAAEINPTFGKIVGFALQIVAPRKSFAREVVEPPPSPRVPEKINILEVKSGRAIDSTGAKQANADWLDRAVESPKPKIPERSNIVEAKAGKTVDSSGANQPNAGWLNRNVEASSSGVPRQSADPGRVVQQKMVGEALQKKAIPANDLPSSGSVQTLPEAVVQNDTMALQQTSSGDVAVQSGSKPVAGGKGVTYEPSASKTPTKPDAKFNESVDSARGKVASKPAPASRSVGGRASNTSAARGTASPAKVPEVAHSGSNYRILGDGARLKAAVRGYHVYEYLDENGRVLYVGQSGTFRGTQPGTNPNVPRVNRLDATAMEKPFHNMLKRLDMSHINTPWIQEARQVRVSYDLSWAEMETLENQIIKDNFGQSYNWNVKGPSARLNQYGTAPRVKIGSDRTVTFDFEAL